MKIKLILFCILFHAGLFAQNTTLTITLKGVLSSDISLQPFEMGVAKEAIVKHLNVKGEQKIQLVVPKEYLPGEFVVRYDYIKEKGATSYPSEQRIIVNNQNLEWKVNPPYCNNSDSTFFQKGEIENKLLKSFNDKVAKEKLKIQVLQDFVMRYDSYDSDLYKMAKLEYLNRTNELNNWIQNEIKVNSKTFASKFFQFSLIPELDLTGDEQKRLNSYIKHYYDQIDFSDPETVKIVAFTSFLNNYVNLVAQNAKLTRNDQLDSLYSEIAKNSIEIAKKGNPYVYGFVVDYFFLGFEKNNLTGAMNSIIPYLKDPNCLTYQKVSIEKRIEGLKNLVIGSLAPNIELSNNIDLVHFNTSKKYKLIVFWSADCGHCEEEMKTLYPFYEKSNQINLFEVIALSVDETDYEIQKWNNKISSLKGWEHVLLKNGISSEQASKYAVISTPSMFLINSKTNLIEYIPKDTKDLEGFLNK